MKYPLIFSYFNKTFFSTDFRKILKYHISWKSFQLEHSCSIVTEGQTDMMKVMFAFHNFESAPKIMKTSPIYSSTKKRCSELFPYTIHRKYSQRSVLYFFQNYFRYVIIFWYYYNNIIFLSTFRRHVVFFLFWS